EGLAAASPTEEVPGEEVLLTHGSGLRDPRSVSGADLIVEQPDEGVERGVEGGGPGAVDPFAVPAAVILLVFEEPVDVLLIKQFAAEALVGHTGAGGLPDLRCRAEEIAFDLPARGGVGVEQPVGKPCVDHRRSSASCLAPNGRRPWAEVTPLAGSMEAPGTKELPHRTVRPGEGVEW